MIKGTVYAGNFFHNNKHGQGKITYRLREGARGKLSYQGEWKDNKPHGRGYEVFAAGDSRVTKRFYDGQFENGQRHGFGILTDSYADIRKIIKKGMEKPVSISSPHSEYNKYFEDDSKSKESAAVTE